jgi:8-amino-7-oxononanoate synthase
VKRVVPPGLAHLSDELANLAAAGLLRERPEPRTDRGVPYCSNDYLGLARRGADGVAAGAGASRLVSGEHTEHVQLEGALSSWLGTEASLLFTSGYAANVGLVSALAGPNDLIVSDELNHASIVDGCRLSRATTRVFPHRDVAAVKRLLGAGVFERRWVVTESYFSMDADSPDLEALRSTCDQEGAALIVDEAHALGVLGPEGRGLSAAAGIVPDVLVGTLGKAFGAGGAFVSGCDELIAWLWNRARSFVFSTGLSPLLAKAALGALAQLREGAELREAAAERAAQIRAGVAALGLKPLGEGHVIPIVFGESATAVRVAERLRAAGFPIQPIRPPSVPVGSARIRLTASAAHTKGDVERLLAALRGAIL